MRVIKYLKGHIPAVLLILALLMVQAFADLSLPRYMADLVDVGIQRGGVQGANAAYWVPGSGMTSTQVHYLASVGLRMLIAATVMMLASIGVAYLASRTGARIAADLRQRLFAKVVSFSDAEIQSFSAASLITRGTNDIQQIQMVITMILRLILYSPILAVGGIVMVARTNASMSWIIALAVAVVFAVVALLMAVAMPKFKIMQELIDRVNLVSREILTGLPVIRAFGRQEHEAARFDRANLKLMRTQLFTNRVMAFMMPVMMLVMNGVSVLIVWVGGFAIDAGTLQTGDMIAFIAYAMVIIMSFLMLTMIAIMLPRAEVAAQRVNEVLQTEPSIKDPAAPDHLPASHGEAADAAAQAAGKGPSPEGISIEFRNVTFAYDAQSEPVLKDISFMAEAGKTTAVVGPTGSGKSTIVKLIERFYDVSSGAVLVDGVDVRRLPQHELRAQLGYVPQKAFLFSGTVRNAVSYGNGDASDRRILQALDIAQATDFVHSREEGLDAYVSQGGTNVSGGQRQRLAIARALATDARAFLFDDSFSALDYKTDAALRQALADNLGGKTVFIVAQRIATIMNADRIVVLDEGRMVGCGTHAELMAACPTYREIAQSQLSAEELEGGGAQ